MSPKLGARRRATRLVSLSIFAFALLCGSASAATETPDETFAASVTAAGEYAEGGVSGDPTVSADGRFVAFLSASADLTPEGVTSTQAYVKDLDSGAVALASRGEGAAGPVADEPVEGALLSAGGRYLVFASAADDLVAGMPTPPVPPVTHVYRRDLQSGDTTLVDRVDGSAGEVLPIAAHVLAVSADGKLVAFTDLAQGLEDPAAAHPEGEETIYVRDLAAGTTTEVAAEGAEEAAFSVDDRYLLFTSSAPTLPEPTGSYEVYRRDLQSGETALVSRGNPTGAAPAGESADGEAYEAVFVGSSDCEVAFLAEGTTDLTPGGGDPPRGVYRRDFCASPPATTLLSINEEGEPFEAAVFPSTTTDGQVAFIAQNEPFDPQHLYLRDPVTQQTTLLDRAIGPEGEPANLQFLDEGAAIVASSGCRAVFTTDAENLFGEEVALPGGFQVVVRQLAPCHPAPPVEKGTEPGPASTSGGSGRSAATLAATAAAKTVTVGHLGPKSVWLVFDGPGRSRLRIQKLIAGRHHGWREVRDLSATAAVAGPVKVEFPALPAGRYRLKFRLQDDPDNPTTTRLLKVGGG